VTATAPPAFGIPKLRWQHPLGRTPTGIGLKKKSPFRMRTPSRCPSGWKLGRWTWPTGQFCSNGGFYCGDLLGSFDGRHKRSGSLRDVALDNLGLLMEAALPGSPLIPGHCTPILIPIFYGMIHQKLGPPFITPEAKRRGAASAAASC
jgi:hypothetical protein